MTTTGPVPDKTAFRPNPPPMPGLDELRITVNHLERCTGDVPYDHSAEELVQLVRLCRRSEWDIFVDQLTDDQIRAALAHGETPRFRLTQPGERGDLVPLPPSGMPPPRYEMGTASAPIGDGATLEVRMPRPVLLTPEQRLTASSAFMGIALLMAEVDAPDQVARVRRIFDRKIAGASPEMRSALGLPPQHQKKTRARQKKKTASRK